MRFVALCLHAWVLYKVIAKSSMCILLRTQFQILAQFYTTSELPNAADVLEAFKKRWSDYYEPAVAISHLLYPANAGRQEDPKLLEKAEIFIREAFGDVHSRALISSLRCYLAKADGFDQKIFDVFVGDMSPVVWWSLADLAVDTKACGPWP